MSTHNYSPGQNVEALRNGQWVPAHIMNPNPDGTYYIIINGRIPEYEWPEANLRGEARPYTMPATTRPAVSTEDLNNYSREWYEQRADAAETMIPENRIEDFINYVRERLDNLDAATEQMVRQYAEQNINILFDDEDMPTQRGGKKRQSRRRYSKKRSGSKRRTKKRISGKKRRSSKRR